MAAAKAKWAALFAGATLALAPRRAPGQSAPRRPPAASPAGAKAQRWQIAGRVVTVQGEPVIGAEVESKAEDAPAAPRIIEADAHGEFRETLPAPSTRSARIQVSLSASQEGYLDARDVVQLDPGHRSAWVELVLRRQVEDPHLLRLETLTSALWPGLQHPVTGTPLAGVQLTHFDLAGRLLDRGGAEDAAPVFAEIAEHDPGCIECWTLAGLAQLQSGGWSSATANLREAAHLAASAPGKGRMPEPFIALGALETWRGNFRQAEVSLLQALEIDPRNSLALQELGRVFVLQGRMTSADRYLERAIARGAGPDAHLLRAQTLLSLGQNANAKVEMDAFLGNRKPKQLAPGLRALWSELNVRSDLESGGAVATLVDRSPAELSAALPELRGLEPARDPSALPSILRKVGESVEALFRGFPDTSSVEELDMERLRRDGKIADSQQQDFQYLMVKLSEESGLRLREYRTDKSGNTTAPLGQGRFMLTDGFASDPLIFHPDFQDGCTFRLLGRQRLDGRDTLVIAFAEQSSRAKMLEGFVINQQSTIVLVQGLAWVDAATYQILRMRTDLLKPAPEIRLERQTTDVRFGQVHFKGAAKNLWVPQQVEVTVYWNGRIFRNLHRYSNYELFQVKTRQKVKALDIPAPPAADPQ